MIFKFFRCKICLRRYDSAQYWCRSVHIICYTHRQLGFQDKHWFQIIPPHDKGIATRILENLEPWPSSWDSSILVGSKLCQDPLSDINAKYMEDLNKLKCFGYLTCSFLLIISECFATFMWKYIISILYWFIGFLFREINARSRLKFTYTAMHGVGYKFIQYAFKEFQFGPCIPVDEQVVSDTLIIVM